MAAIRGRPYRATERETDRRESRRALPQPSPDAREPLVRLQAAGNAAVAQTLTRRGQTATLARLRTSKKWLKDSDISIGPSRTTRSPELQRIDQEVLAFEGLVKTHATPQARLTQLIEIEKAINDWRQAKGGTVKAENRARGPHVSALYDEVLAEKSRVQREITREKIENIDATLLDNLPDDASAAGWTLFDRFMTRFRGSAKYTLTTGGQKSPWDGGTGPFACGTFAKALADLALAAGLDAKHVKVTPINFVTRIIDADFVDRTAQGNVQVNNKRKKRYFFTEHWVTQIGGQFYCPTSGKVLNGRAATELVDPAIGQLKSLGGGAYGRDGITVRKVGTTADGGGLYDLVGA